MKKIAIIIIVSLYALTSYAQLEMYARYTLKGKVEPSFNLYGEKKMSEKVNLTYFALVEEKWSEALIGFSYSPKDWVSFGLSAGIEHNPAIYRLAGSVWFGKGKNSLLLLVEKGDGTDNYWYKFTASHQFSENFSLGARAWRFHGIGSLVNYTPKNSSLTLWLFPAYDPEFKAKRIMLGLSVKI